MAVFGRFGRVKGADRRGVGAGDDPGGSVDPTGQAPIGFEESPQPDVAGGGSGSSGSSDHHSQAAPEPRWEVKSMLLCSRCGHANADGSRFCSNCGNSLSGGSSSFAGERPNEMTSTMAFGALAVAEGVEQVEAADPEAASLEAIGADSALLVVRRGPNAGSRFLLDAQVTTAGRAPDSDIFLDDVTVSRRHAEFTRAAQGFLVRDVGSLNGTYVNRERIEEVLLADGDEVQIGKYRLVLRTGRR